jgi:uncharacterized protein
METDQNLIKLSTGSFKIEELEAIFNNMPFEVSFVDKDDTVRFFNNKTDRFFLRAQAAIGKDMRFCHPKKYLPMVEQILSDFKSGKENHALFWRSDHKGKFISIEYFAMRDENQEYIGVLEIVQDITNIKLLEGDRNELVYE